MLPNSHDIRQAITECDMAGVNKVIIVGNLGRDPEVRSFPNGGKVVNLRIATSETWRDKASGERRERTEWHSVAIFSEPVGRIAEMNPEPEVLTSFSRRIGSPSICGTRA